MTSFASRVAVVLAGVVLIAPATSDARALGQTRAQTAANQRKAKRDVARRAGRRRARNHVSGRKRRGAVRRSTRAGRAFVRLGEGEGYKRMRPQHAWGTRYTVKHLTTVLAAHHAEHAAGAELIIGDLSRRRGGRLGPHRSHRTGRDVDIWLPKQSERRRWDVPRTWALISAFQNTGAVEMIFLDYRLQRVLYRYAKRELGLDSAALGKVFEYPNRRRPKGPIRSLLVHSPGHRDHLHVRFHRRRLAPPPTS